MGMFTGPTFSRGPFFLVYSVLAQNCRIPVVSTRKEAAEANREIAAEHRTARGRVKGLGSHLVF